MASPAAAMLEEESFPMGYRFCPTNEELIFYYLMKQQTNKPLSKSVHEVDFYLNNPWTLQSFYSTRRVKETYFITHRNRPKPSGHNEQIGEGYWKAYKNYEKVTNSGVRKTYVYSMFSEGQRLQKTNWIMKEYRIKTEEIKLDGQVLCVLSESKRNRNTISHDTEPLNLLKNGRQDQGGSLDERSADSLSEQHGIKDLLTTLDKPLPQPLLRSCLPGAEDHEVLGITSCNDKPHYQMATELNPPPPLPPVSNDDGIAYFEDREVGNTQGDYQGPNKATEMSESEHEEESLPIGVRFSPTDEEIILYYLMNHPCKSPLAKVVNEVDFYAYDPWTLKRMYPMSRVKESYFLTRRIKKYVGGYRPDRKAGEGYWKSVTTDRRILIESGDPVGGVHKTLVYYKAGKPRKKTNWIMKEYRLGEPGEKDLLPDRNSGSQTLHGMVFCKLYETKSTNKSSGFNVEEEGAGNGETEWNEGNDTVEDMDKRGLEIEGDPSTIFDGIGTTNADLTLNPVYGYPVSTLREVTFPLNHFNTYNGLLGVQQASLPLDCVDNYNGMHGVAGFDRLRYFPNEPTQLSSNFLQAGFMNIPGAMDYQYAPHMYYLGGVDHINGVPSGTVSQDLSTLEGRVTKPQRPAAFGVINSNFKYQP